MIFDGIISSALVFIVPGSKQLGNLFPLTSHLSMRIKYNNLFLLSPWISIDLRIEMIVPSIL